MNKRGDNIFLPFFAAHWTSVHNNIPFVWLFRLTWQRDIRRPPQPSSIRRVSSDPVRLADVYHRYRRRIRHAVSNSKYYLAGGLCQLTTTIAARRHSLAEISHGQNIWIIQVNTVVLVRPERWVVRYVVPSCLVEFIDCRSVWYFIQQKWYLCV